jgi:DNA-binding transcriptional LysR family regulator
MLDARKLRLLRDLAQRGTIAAVAEALAYTPSAVSQQLAALEREAGVRLLRRSGRRVALTYAGTVLVEQAEAVLSALERASAAVAAVRADVVGPLRIGAFPTAVRTLLPDALVAIGRDHPGLELMVTELDPVAVPDALRAGRLDVGLVHDYDYVPLEPDPALDTEPLIEEAMYLAAWPDARRRGGDPLREHASERWIMASPGTLCHTMTLRACQAAGFEPRVPHHADDFATVLALVAAGQGVALVPELATVDATDGVALTRLASRRRTLIAYRRGSGRHPAIAACVAAMRAAADRMIPPDQG